MDDVTANLLVTRLKKAKTTKDKVEAMAESMIALIDCQKKTSERVKALVKRNEEQDHKKEGAKWVLGIVYAVVTFLCTSGSVMACKFFGLLK